MIGHAVPAHATNSIVAGALGRARISLVLVLQLNPQCRWRRRARVALVRHDSVRRLRRPSAVVFYALIVVREFFASTPFSPGWVSVRVLAGLRRRRRGGRAIADVAEPRGFRAALDARPRRRWRRRDRDDRVCAVAARRARHRCATRSAGAAAVPAASLFVARDRRVRSALPLARAWPRGRPPAPISARGSRSARSAAERTRPARLDARCSTAPRSITSAGASPKGGCRTSAACSNAAR